MAWQSNGRGTNECWKKLSLKIKLNKKRTKTSVQMAYRQIESRTNCSRGLKLVQIFLTLNIEIVNTLNGLPVNVPSVLKSTWALIMVAVDNDDKKKEKRLFCWVHRRTEKTRRIQ